MAKKKKSSKYSSAKKTAATSKENKSDMSTAASASSPDDTLNDAVRPAAEPRAAAARTQWIFHVEQFMTDAFPEITSATLKKYVKNEQQENTYREFRQVARDFSKHGYHFAFLALTFIFISVIVRFAMEPEKDGPMYLPLVVKADIAPIVASVNGILQLDPVYAVHNHIEDWMGFVSAALFTIVILRIAIACKRTANSHIRGSSCHLHCVYCVVPVAILVAAICLAAVWMQKLMQLFNYFISDPSVTIPVQIFTSFMYICQPVFEYSTCALIALHRLRLFYHRYYSGVYYASKLGVPIQKWVFLTFVLMVGEMSSFLLALFIAKCYLILTAIFTSLDDVVDILDICWTWFMSSQGVS